jgi:chitin disaccharide deacetylase
MSEFKRGLTNRLLGYPEDARLLLLNADDFGMTQSINQAILQTLQKGLVHSTSLMPVCPWTLEGMQILHDHPEIPFGVHLTVICDSKYRDYEPLTPPEKVPSLVDGKGHFYNTDQMDELLAQADIHELETEFRAQIEKLVASLKPTHVDWHCLHSGGRADIFDMTFGLAREYGLALRVGNHPHIEQVQSKGLPSDDYDLLDSYSLEIPNKSATYAQMLRELPAGLTEWAVHPGLGDSELRTIEPDSWQVRQTDYDFFMSQEAQDIIKAEGIILIDTRTLQTIWNQTANESMR